MRQTVGYQSPRGVACCCPGARPLAEPAWATLTQQKAVAVPASMPHVCPPPAATASNERPPVTCTGTFEVSALPRPSWPEVPRPCMGAREGGCLLAAAATFFAQLRLPRPTGMPTAGSKQPLTQHHTLPRSEPCSSPSSGTSPQVCSFPAASVVNERPPSTATGTSEPSVAPLPSCPLPPAPQQKVALCAAAPPAQHAATASSIAAVRRILSVVVVGCQGAAGGWPAAWVARRAGGRRQRQRGGRAPAVAAA